MAVCALRIQLMKIGYAWFDYNRTIQCANSDQSRRDLTNAVPWRRMMEYVSDGAG